MRIVTIFTGGTIGSKINWEGIISTNQEAPYQLLEQYRKVHGENILFDTRDRHHENVPGGLIHKVPQSARTYPHKSRNRLCTFLPDPDEKSDLRR